VPHLVATVNAEKNDARSSVRRDAGLSPGLSPGPERSEYTPDMAASRDRDGSRDAGGAKADASTSSTTAQAIREHSAGSAIICGVQWVLCVTHKHIMVHPIKVCWLELICKVEEMWMIGHAWMEQINSMTSVAVAPSATAAFNLDVPTPAHSRWEIRKYAKYKIHFPKKEKNGTKIEGTVDFVPANACNSNLSDASHDLIVFF